MKKTPKFFELVRSNGSAIMGTSATNLKEAKKLFKERGHFTGGFTVNEYSYDGKVKKGLCIQF